MKYLLLVLTFMSLSLYSQVDIPVYSDYLTDNYYLIHPSMAGAANCAKIRATGRQQWFGNDKAPALQTLSVNGSVDEEAKSGVGLILFNDRNGNHSNRGLKATYAHHIRFSRNDIDLNRLSFGVNVGVNQLQLDETEFGTTFDPIIGGGVQSASYYNIDFGASYNFLDFYIHATVKNAVFKSRNIYTDVESSNLRKYVFNSGYVLGNRDRILYEPSIMFQFTELTKERIVDLNIKAYKNMNFGKLWAGLSYRNSFDGTQYIKNEAVEKQRLQYVTPIVGTNYKKFMLAYTYSYIIGDAKFDKGGFHQLTLGFDFGCKREKFDCNCPSVN
ncbi:type IX secretion system membrane protein PorP/SprF [Flavobacterium davisii]|uniref:Type IX secretion system membrane protein PorP/SprF n=1 Tax=Flavobacterium columnare TaxID=996 RepID=A0A8G0KWN1_9FLAO|nr:type IX secretion system membrane protein PorP/SprF [Flavobacterium davisii]QYS89847.1 type IX secretion system membrane protein PorP/SprF [Flavobacterium davisii]